MAKYSNTIEYNIKTSLDSKGLTQLKNELRSVELSLQKMGDKDLLNTKSFSDARVQIQNLRESLSKAFDPSLGILDLSKLNTELKESGITASSLKSAFTQAGSEGQVAFNNLVKELGRVDTGIQRSNSSLDKMFTTFSNTFRWGLVSSFFSQFLNAIHQSVDYVKELDDSLTQIMLVTDYNRDSMNEYAKSANDAAKALSMSTTGMTNASLVFAQQGYNLSQSQELATLSAKLANASQQDTATTSDQITAYMNAYGLQNSMEELAQQMDNWALIANVSAADVSELAQASQRAASMANTVGVTGEQLAAQIATIESVTREAPEQIGNGLKTLYARFSDISEGGEDEEGVSLGDVTSQLNAIGVQILDQFGNIRNVGDIMEDLMVVWDDLDQTSKIAAAQALAGKYQVNRFVSLMDNSDMYREYKGATGSAAIGTLDEMNQEYAESLAGRTQKLSTTLEGIFNNIFNTDTFYPFIDTAQKALDVIDKLTEAMGGGIPIIASLTTAFLNLFSKNIAQQINDTRLNAAVQRQKQENFQDKAAALTQLGLVNPNPEDKNSQNILNYAQELSRLSPNLNNTQLAQGNQLIEDMVRNSNMATEAQAELDTQLRTLGTTIKTVLGKDGNSLIPFMDEGALNTSAFNDFFKNIDKAGLKEIFSGSREEIQATIEDLQELSNALQYMRDEARKTEDEERDLDEAIQLGSEALSRLKNEMSPEDYSKLNKAFEDFSQTLLTGQDDINKTGDAIDGLTVDVGELIENLLKFAQGDISLDEIRAIIDKAEALNFRRQSAQDATNDTAKLGQTYIDAAQFQIATQHVIDLTAALGQLGSAVSMIQHLGAIIKDEDMAPTEKFVQILSNVSILIPTVLTSLNNMSKAIKGLQEDQLLYNTALLISQTRQLLTTASLGTENIVVLANAEAKKKMTAESIKAAAAELGISGASVKLAIILAGLNPVILGVIAAFALLGGITLKHLWDEAKEAEAQQKAFNELADQTQETANQLKNSAQDLNELYEAYRITGEASEEFKQSLENQAELLGINDAALMISRGKYEELKNEIDAATEAVLNNNAALQQAKLDNINPNDMVNELSDDQKERYGITYHQEEGITNLSGGTAEKGLINKLDQNPYEIVKAAQDDVINQQNTINELTLKRNQLVKDGLQADEQTKQALADQISEIDEEINKTSLLLSESQQFVDEHQDILDATKDINEFALNTELASPNSIFNEDYDTIKEYIEALGLKGIDSSNIDEWIQKYAELAENIEAAAYAELNMVQNQVEQNPYVYTGIRSGEAGLNAIGNLELSNENKLKVAQLFDWTDPEIDSKVADLCNAINEGLRQGLSLDQILAEQIEINPEDYFSNAESKDSNIDAEELQDVAKYIHENNDLLEQYADDLEEVPEVTLEAADAQLRYNKAVERAEKNLDKWKEDLQDLADGEENIEDLTETTNELRDTYEELLNIDPGALSESFLVDPTNLENLEAAIRGDEEAYWDLWEAAQTDILIQAGMDSDQAYAAAADLRSVLYDYGWDDIEIGASLSGEDEILDACERIINAAGMTSEQAQQYLADMGISAKVTEQTEETEDKTEAVGWKAEKTQPIPVTSEVITKPWSAGEMPSTETVTSYIGGYRMVPIPSTDTATGSNTAVSMEVETAGGQKGGGKLTIDRSTARKTGGTGKQKSSGRSGVPSSSGGGGGGGKKGGGGGSGKTPKTPKAYEPKTKEPIKKEIDLYEKVNTQLDDVETTLKDIEKEEDRLIGDKARANMDKQISLLSKEIDLQKEKLKIQQQEQSDLAKELTGYGYKFDSDGFITNYNEIIKSYETRLNNLIDQYNKTTTEEGQEALDKQIKQLEKEYDKAKKAADRYDQLQGKELQDTLNAIEELKDAIEDLRIEAWKASTEAIDNIKELRESAAELEGLFSKYESDSPFRDLIVEGEKLNNIWSVGKDQAKDYYNEIIADKRKALKFATDEAEKAAIERSIKYFESLRDTLSDQRLNNGLLGLAYQDMLQLKEWYENPKAEDNLFGDNTAALRDAYEEAYNKVHDMLLEYEKTVEDYRDAIIDGYDEIDEKQNRQIDKFDRIVDKLETFSDMYTLYYGDESYAALRDILQQQGDTLREQLNAQKEIYSYWSEAYAQAIKTGDEKLIQELEDKMHDAEDRMTELAEEAAKAFAESYENAVKASTQYIIQNTIGDRNFDRLDRNWEWDKDYLDKYRDDVEKAYEMDKLRNKYTDLLNQAQGASLQTQNKIRAQMQEQLDLLDGQATVSEYDVKLANAKLEILQKQIALEDAQRNKNQMKLRRDTQGNYRYVYTADQKDVAGAEQDLLDSEYDAYELSKNQQISNYDNLINAYQKYLSQREEILNNANLSEAEKLQQNAELYDKFLKFVDAAKEDFSDAAFGTLDILNWLTLNGTDYTTTAAKDMLNDLLDEQGNIKDQTGVIWMDNANYLTDEVIPKIKGAVNEADQDIKNRMEELKENIVGDDGVFPSIREGGKNLEEGLSGLTGFLDSAKTSTDGLAVATRDLMEALGGDNSALAEAQAQLQKYEEELSNVKNASSITAQQLRDAQKALDKSQAENLNYKTQLDDIASGKRDTKGNLVNKKNTKKTGAAPSKSSKKNGELTGFTGVYHYTSWGDNPAGDWYAGIPNAVRISTFSREPWDGPYNVHLETKEGGHLGWVKEEQLFDTGGYTGNWANGDKRENGKLAFLHQKELVLNAEDTQNILAAVDIVRKIGVGLRNSMMNVSSMNGQNLSSVGETIEQRVEITASFPNATDADDIRQALIGLADKAYQYSHRNR